MSRETCICEIPTCVGDLALGEALEEAQAQDLALARGELVEAAAQHQRAARRARSRRRRLADRLERPEPVGAAARRATSCGRRRRRSSASTHLLDAWPRAGGELVDRRRAAEVARQALARARRGAALSSWTSRGTRSIQPRSRKWRLISPAIVGTAKVAKLARRGRGRSGRSPSAARPRRPARGRRAARPCSRSAARGCARAAASARRAPHARAWSLLVVPAAQERAASRPLDPRSLPGTRHYLPVLPALIACSRSQTAMTRWTRLVTPPTCAPLRGDGAGWTKADRRFRRTRFAALTGVSRERLRTWERRYGFPRAPCASTRGPRRYALDDVQRVVAVRRAAEAGVPIPRAIERTRLRRGAGAPGAGDVRRARRARAGARGGAVGPRAAARGVRQRRAARDAGRAAPRRGADHGAARASRLAAACSRSQQLFAHGAAARPRPSTPRGTATRARPRARRSTACPSEPDARPLVAMVGARGRGRARRARARWPSCSASSTELRRRDERHTRWLDALAAAAPSEFRREPGPRRIDTASTCVIRQTNARRRRRSPSTSRGQLVAAALAPRRARVQRRVTVAAHPELARCLRDAEPTWLDAAASPRLGVPADLHASAMPIVVAGEPLGLLVFVFDEVEPHDDDNRRLLTAVSAAMGFALLRDRLPRSCARRRSATSASRRDEAPGPSARCSRAPAYARRRAIDWRMMRETCICETPMRSPISACVRSSSKRRRSTSRSRGVIERMRCSIVARSSASAKPCSSVPSVSPSVSPASSSLPRGDSSDVALVGARRLERLEHRPPRRRRPSPRSRRPSAGGAGRATARRRRGRPSARAPAGRAGRAPTTCGRGSGA